MTDYDAFILISFGGPESLDDVMPFLKNVLRGKNIPEARMLEVAEHYNSFGGVSPINQQMRDLLENLAKEMEKREWSLPIYWGNRNWKPYIQESLEQIRKDGHKKVLAFFVSAYSSYSGCRQYREDIDRALTAMGGGLEVDKLRVFYNHKGFTTPFSDDLTLALKKIDRSQPWKVLFCAHSIPTDMAKQCRYEKQLLETSRIIAENCGLAEKEWELVYQSRSGPPHQPWLEPDVCDRIEELHQEGELSQTILVPVGFISDHMEVIYDLDHEAKELCEELEIGFQRTATVDKDPRFVNMILDLVEERMGKRETREFVGVHGASHDICPKNCCLPR